MVWWNIKCKVDVHIFPHDGYHHCSSEIIQASNDLNRNEISGNWESSGNVLDIDYKHNFQIESCSHLHQSKTKCGGWIQKFIRVMKDIPHWHKAIFELFANSSMEHHWSHDPYKLVRGIVIGFQYEFVYRLARSSCRRSYLPEDILCN